MAGTPLRVAGVPADSGMTAHAFFGHMELIVAVFALGLLAVVPVAAIILIRDAIVEMRAA